MADMKLIRDMAAAMSASPAKPAPYDTVAEVVRIDGNTAWVHIPGGVDETPVQMSINARSGDQVRIRVAGGQAWVVGNNTSPPTDDKKAEEAQAKADEVSDYVATHMEETDAGLVITKDGSGWKVLVASDGFYVMDATGSTVAKYASEAVIGRESDIHLNISGSDIVMSSPIEPLVTIQQTASAPEDGNYSGRGALIARLAAGETKKWIEGIVVSTDYPFVVSINNGASATYTAYGTYTYGNFSVILEEDGYSLRNDTSSAITNIAFTTSEYYAIHYYGSFSLGDVFSINSHGSVSVPDGSTFDGIDVSEVARGENAIITTNFLATGMITNSRQDIRFFIPYNVLGGNPIIEELNMVVRTADGGYPYFRSGTNGGTYTQIGSSNVAIIEDGEPVRSGEYRQDCACTLIPRSGLIVRLYLNYGACSDNNGTLVTNNIPLVIEGNITIYLEPTS